MESQNQIAHTLERDFSKYWLIGLGWGIVAATVTITVSLAAVMFASLPSLAAAATTMPMLMIGAFYGLAVSIVLVIVLIGPLSALLAWPLYRMKVTRAWPYVSVGALSAVSVPVFVIAMNFGQGAAGSTYARPSDLLPLFLSSSADFISSSLLLLAWFALIGAFAGGMTARALRRDVYGARLQRPSIVARMPQ